MQGNSSRPSEDQALTIADAESALSGGPERTPFDELPPVSKPIEEPNLAPQSVAMPTAWPKSSLDVEEGSVATTNGSDRSSAFGGCSTGALSLMPFLFVLAMLRKAGLPIDAPTMMALISGGILLAIAVKSWPRRTILWLGGYVVGLLVAYALLWFVLRPFVVSQGRNASPATGQTMMPADS